MNNRNRNPNEYRVTNNLGNRSRSRHSAIMNRFILTTLLPHGFIYKLDSNGNRTGRALDPARWKWGTIGPRIGSRRSADGMLYTLPNASMNNTKQNNAVIKIIFAEDDSPKQEVIISKMMSAHRLGPRIFECYSADIDMNLLMRNIGMNRLQFRNGPQRGQSFINLFQTFTQYLFGRGQTFSKVYILVMENLYKNPSRGVKNGFTVDDLMKHKPGTAGVKFPYEQFVYKFNKMHELGIIHGDMHPGNIIVQALEKNKFGVRIIDFGRSIHTGRPITTQTEANTILEQMARNRTGRVDRLRGHEATHVVVNGLPRLFNSKGKNYINTNLRNGVFQYEMGVISGRKQLYNSAQREYKTQARKFTNDQQKVINILKAGITNMARQIATGPGNKRRNVLINALLTHRKRLEKAVKLKETIERRRRATLARREGAVAGAGASTRLRAAVRYGRRNASLARKGAKSASRIKASLIGRGASYGRRIAEANMRQVGFEPTR